MHLQRLVLNGGPEVPAFFVPGGYRILLGSAVREEEDSFSSEAKRERSCACGVQERALSNSVLMSPTLDSSRSAVSFSPGHSFFRDRR